MGSTCVHFCHVLGFGLILIGGSSRRSRPSGEIEKELGAGSSSMTPRNITPLTPLTSLRWKSNPREQEEEEKAMEQSRFGMPRDEENPRAKLAAGNGKEDRAAEGQQQVAEVAAHDPTNSVDELSTKGQAGNVDDTVSLEPTEVLGRYYGSIVALEPYTLKLKITNLKGFHTPFEIIFSLCFMIF